jgi:predicted O-methyltransferase YrrM
MRQRLKALEMRARAMAPASLRRAYRLGKSLSAPVVSQELPRALLADCRMCADRLDLIASLPKGGLVAELGTYKGDFARAILDIAAPRELHVIDIDYSQFSANLVDPRLVRHVGLTHDVIAAEPDGKFDWIYIDADHSYEGALRDAKASAPKVRPGGYLVFNDFAHIDPWLGRYGVHRAAIDFALSAGWRMSHFAYHPCALYDVALQRPD